ncbi:hypothetical protein IFVP182_C1170149 [Vibrio parahaemolyticus]
MITQGKPPLKCGWRMRTYQSTSLVCVIRKSMWLRRINNVRLAGCEDVGVAFVL